MAVDPATVSYLLSAVASTAKIIEFGIGLAGRRPSAKEMADATKAANAYASQKFGISSPAVTAMANGSWSQQIVDAIKKRMDESKDRSIKIIESDTLDDFDRKKRLNQERRNFCAHLDELRRYNGGKLPPDLQEEWALTCYDYVP
jgi:hypothetical protein